VLSPVAEVSTALTGFLDDGLVVALPPSSATLFVVVFVFAASASLFSFLDSSTGSCTGRLIQFSSCVNFPLLKVFETVCTLYNPLNPVASNPVAKSASPVAPL
jgi:hypothetical protein